MILSIIVGGYEITTQFFWDLTRTEYGWNIKRESSNFKFGLIFDIYVNICAFIRKERFCVAQEQSHKKSHTFTTKWKDMQATYAIMNWEVSSSWYSIRKRHQTWFACSRETGQSNIIICRGFLNRKFLYSEIY